MKKVQFNEAKNEVHRMIQWSYAYRLARDNVYERLAWDRFHFQRRIQCLSNVLNEVFTVEHRQNIYCERFIECKCGK